MDDADRTGATVDPPSDGPPQVSLRKSQPGPPPAVSLRKQQPANIPAEAVVSNSGPATVPAPSDTVYAQPPARTVQPLLPLPPEYPPTSATPSRRRLTPTHWILLGLATVAAGAVAVSTSLSSEESRPSFDTAEIGQQGAADGESSNSRTPGGEQNRTPALSNTFTVDDMRTFVLAHYADLPANPSATWSRLDPHFTAKFSWSDYIDFWSSIASVRVDSVRPRNINSVVARLTYLRRDGGVDTEDRWLSFVSENGKLALFDSERIGSVS